MTFRFPLVGAAVVALFLCPTLPADDPAQAFLEELSQVEPLEPQVSPASEEARQAMGGFRVPEGVRVELFAAEPLLANPVAFWIDERGRVYVCETYRQGKGVEDNRNHMVWLEDDLSLRSVDDRLRMFHKHLGDAVREYVLHDDRIRLLEDTDGDGVADRSTVFADHFNDVVEGTLAGVLARGGDVYATNIPNLWLLRDTDGDGVADTKEVLQEGFGVRVAFRGHDMHGLILGPDGRLYFSIGDRGYNLKTREGRTFVRPDTGAVFRCELDGSHLEVFAYGLRNPQELAFDNFGNLFTGDNNSDSGDQARWVHVVEGGDSGWRMSFQYLEDRGPWNRERMWFPYRSDEETTRLQPAYIVPPVANVSDGPSGLVFYPGVGLPERYNDHFFLADFRGATANSGIRSFAVQERGATFELVDSHWYIESILATDVDFGWDGSLFVSDWVDGWYGPGKGRIYRFRHQGASLPDGVESAGMIMAAGLQSLEIPRLVSLLDHPDRRIRQESQFELARRDAVDALVSVANSTGTRRAQLHAVWGLWQIGRRDRGGVVADHVAQLAASDDAEIRAQAVRVLGEIGNEAHRGVLEATVQKGTPREQAFAAIGLGRIGRPSSFGSLFQLLESNADGDPVLRHAAVMGLAGAAQAAGTPDQALLTAAKTSENSASVRLGTVLALRRLHSAQLARFLADPDPRVAEEAARAIHDEPVVEALPFLAALAESSDLPLLSDALLRRVLNANYRLGGPHNARHVVKIATSEGITLPVRKEALFALKTWGHPPVLDRVTNEYRPMPARSLDAARAAVAESLALLLDVPAPLQADALELVSVYQVENAESRLFDVLQSEAAAGEVRAAALAALGALGSPRLGVALEAALVSPLPELRMAAYRIVVRTDPMRAVSLLDEVIANDDASLGERQLAIALLGEIATPAAVDGLLSRLQQIRAGDPRVPASLQLDVILAARSIDDTRLKSELNALEQSYAPDDRLAAWRMALVGGNASRGRQVFFGNAAASCRRCHTVQGQGSAVGPDLSAIGKDKSREYLLEAIVDPNATIAKGFETRIFVMQDGRVHTGIVRSQTDAIVELVTAQGELIRVPRDEIDVESEGRSGMPDDLIKSLSHSEVRDLVEYLTTLTSVDESRQSGHSP